MKRRALSKKTRFEVLKRDRFICVYCGESAPKVILHVDHVLPVAEGGTNRLTNLVASCQPCNAGKGKVRIDDQSAIVASTEARKQAAQRSEQLAMMVAWQREIDDIDERETIAALETMARVWPLGDGYVWADHVRLEIRSLITRFGLSDTCDAIRIACARYPESARLKKIGGIAFNRMRERNG